MKFWKKIALSVLVLLLLVITVGIQAIVG